MRMRSRDQIQVWRCEIAWGGTSRLIRSWTWEDTCNSLWVREKGSSHRWDYCKHRLTSRYYSICVKAKQLSVCIIIIRILLKPWFKRYQSGNEPSMIPESSSNEAKRKHERFIVNGIYVHLIYNRTYECRTVYCTILIKRIPEEYSTNNDEVLQTTSHVLYPRPRPRLCNAILTSSLPLLLFSISPPFLTTIASLSPFASSTRFRSRCA